MSASLDPRNLDFLLHEVLGVAALAERQRYRGQTRDDYDAVVASAKSIADRELAPHFTAGDAREPWLEDGEVRHVPGTQEAWNAIAEAGFLRAHCDEDEGGLQLPEPVLRAASAHFHAANGPTHWYAFLTIGVINLLRAFGDDEQRRLFLPALMTGRCAGTMALTEPGQGSALADIRTRAEPAPDGTWRLFGTKMFISGGEHALAGNIAHMVLAKARGAPPGVKGISLFLVPKRLVDADGNPGPRNDVALGGLLHKLGNRNITSTVLGFGERDGAVGTLVGGLGEGLRCMFQMMNEARIGVGLNAAALACRGFEHALGYARSRPQGRLPSSKDPASPQAMLIEHADIRRMLLQQKAYAEGAMALCLYASMLAEDERTHPDTAARAAAGARLGLLTPVVKSWSSKYGVAANDLAIQVLGGAGYLRDHPLEQLLRDQRLNPIHEGAEGIHGLDLLGRKLVIDGGAAFAALLAEMRGAIAAARGEATIAVIAARLEAALADLERATRAIEALRRADIDLALANATVYLDAFGRVLVGWLWLRQAAVAAAALRRGANGPEAAFHRGKVHAARYFAEWELAQNEHACRLLAEVNAVPYDMRDSWF
ncbi:MAG: acyl-CoA dehydrogenase [Alphaproteobacteria bacterium]|nr:acyl-CoA dehydrogenase [Alphaproteobacteria bacterium]